MSRPGWEVDHRHATAADLLARWPAPDRRSRRVVAVCEVSGPPALVLGSTQSVRSEQVPGAAPGPGGCPSRTRHRHVVVRRRTGGGAVLVGPGQQAWVDVWLPRGDPLWDDDVVRSAGWLGTAWVSALHRMGIPPERLQIHRFGLRPTTWSPTVCFASVGPGEVLADGRKLMGLAQRRTGEGAWFHTAALRRWRPAELVAALAAAGAAPVGLVAPAAGDGLLDMACGLGDVPDVPRRFGDPAAVAAAVADAVVEAFRRSPR